jgi:hypothetical protein
MLAAPKFRMVPSRRPLALAFLLSAAVFATAASTEPEKKEKSKAPATAVLRWDESQPGCTFTAGDDGKYRYGLWSDDLGVTLAVDAREVQIVSHRIEPIFGVFLSVRYRGENSVELSPGEITLQFVKHFKVVETSLDPDDYIQKIQAHADMIDDDARRMIAKRPQEKQSLEARLQKYQKSVSELIEFLGKNGLHATHLDRGNPEASGWVFFNTDTKWVGRLKAQEEFVLRLPLAGRIFEFPFKLPPKAGELLLRKRE